MKLASKESLNELYKLENEYFKLIKVSTNESARCLLRGELVEGFVKSPEMVKEAIEKLKIKIEDTKINLHKKEEDKAQRKKEMEEDNKKRGFINLTGSEKQVKWANDLRLQLIEKVDKIKEESKEDKDLEILKRYFSHNNIQNISIELIEQTLNHILSTKVNATYYIDNRYSNIFDILIEEIRNMQEEP